MKVKDVEFLAEQIEDFGESWKADHEEAMQCRDLEKALGGGIGLFHCIRLADQVWSEQVQDGKIEFDAKIAKMLRNYYEFWLAPVDRILSAVQKFEANYEVEGAEEFRRCIRHARRVIHIPLSEIVSTEKATPLTEEDWGGVSA